MRPTQICFLMGLLALTLPNGASQAQTAAGEAVSPDSVAVAETDAAPMPDSTEPVPDAPTTAMDLIEYEVEDRSAAPVSAGDIDLRDFVWQNRVLVIFADTEQDLNFLRQMDLIAARLLPLEERGVVVLTDTDPGARSKVRTKLRPRGFAAVLVDKDGRVISRRPSPWDVREIERTIDSTPLRLQELREKRDAIDPIRGGAR